MLLTAIILAFVLSAATTWWITPMVTRLALEKRWVDDPDGQRKLHKTPIPRVGGIAIVGGFLVGLSFLAIAIHFFKGEVAEMLKLPSPEIIIGALVMAGVGLYDDIRELHFGPKFAAQIAVALLLVAGGFRIQEIFNPFTDQALHLPVWVSVVLSIGWIVGAINAINLLDGMDGLASGVSVIVFGSLTAAYFALGDLTHAAWIAVIVGSVVGFIRYNFNPAQIFMGDSGSMFLGFLIAAYSLEGASRAHSLLALLIPVIAMGLPVMDTGLAIVRRFLERRHLFHADGDHIHHRLVKRLGLSHRNTVLILYVISVAFGIAAFLLAISRSSFGDTVMAPIVLVVTGIGIFTLLKFLGYLKVPRKFRPAPGSNNGRHPMERESGDASDAEVDIPWDVKEAQRQRFTVGKSSSE